MPEQNDTLISVAYVEEMIRDEDSDAKECAEQGYDALSKDSIKHAAALRSLLEMLEALKFYGDERNHATTSTGFDVQYDPETPAVRADKGSRARAALAKWEEHDAQLN